MYYRIWKYSNKEVDSDSEETLPKITLYIYKNTFERTYNLSQYAFNLV